MYFIPFLSYWGTVLFVETVKFFKYKEENDIKNEVDRLTVFTNTTISTAYITANNTNTSTTATTAFKTNATNNTTTTHTTTKAFDTATRTAAATSTATATSTHNVTATATTTIWNKKFNNTAVIGPANR